MFSSFLATVKNYYDPACLELMVRAAASSPSPTTVESAYQLLGSWTGTGLKIPTPIPPSEALSFPADHGEHWDTPIEWRFYTLSLDLAAGGRVSVIANFFRKAIATAASAPGVRDLDRQIYSTSIATTIEMLDTEPIHYCLPVATLAPVEGGVEVGNEPFRMVVGKNSIVGGGDVFPLHIHVEDSGDPTVGRPSIRIDVECADANPLFLQGENGYVGPQVKVGEVSSVGWYYYSWPQLPTTGMVTIGGTEHGVAAGRTWMDHQWGGSPPPATPKAPAWTGWCWFEFQFAGDRSLTVACPHQGITNGTLPPALPGFGTYVEKGVSTLVMALLDVSDYTKSPDTDARYPSSWLIEVKTPDDNSVALAVSPRTVLNEQAMWMGGLTEYSEAASTVGAIGIVDGNPVAMEGVGYCEGVGFEDPDETHARAKTWLRDALGEPG
jgi:predicted secreted hydrolase